MTLLEIIQPESNAAVVKIIVLENIAGKKKDNGKQNLLKKETTQCITMQWWFVK
ncbi:MAG: hypothetical protein LH679_11545 [Cyanobacteria bacterium CAN_BIN43]|nr:hypothetical protein [Cyanobacteria bacterium CAN_BIN43]